MSAYDESSAGDPAPLAATTSGTAAAPAPETAPNTPPRRDPPAAATTNANWRQRVNWQWVAIGVVFVTMLALMYNARSHTLRVRDELARRTHDLEANIQQSRALVTDARDTVRDLQNKLAVIESRLADSQSQQAALDALYRELSPGRDDIILTEVEQTLMLANQQLQLAGNVQGALAALQAADARLQRLDRPQFVPLRKAIAKDMERLKAVPFIDVVGMSLRLDNVVATVDKLPLAAEERPLAQAAPQTPPPPTADESMWRRLSREVWNDLTGLVRIQNVQKQEIPVLAPAQSYFLRENLKLRLVGARLALLGRDEASFRADLKACEEWLTRFYDGKSRPVQAALTTVRQLSGSQIGIDLPDINTSMEAVRQLRLSREVRGEVREGRGEGRGAR